jgi:hypothetical protein
MINKVSSVSNSIPSKDSSQSNTERINSNKDANMISPRISGSIQKSSDVLSS